MDKTKIKKIVTCMVVGAVTAKAVEKVFEKAKGIIKKVIHPKDVDEHLEELSKAFDE